MEKHIRFVGTCESIKNINETFNAGGRCTLTDQGPLDTAGYGERIIRVKGDVADVERFCETFAKLTWGFEDQRESREQWVNRTMAGELVKEY